MTGKELKDAISIIPDNAVVYISGPDNGGYDWTYVEGVQIDQNERKTAWFIKGVDQEICISSGTTSPHQDYPEASKK